MKQGTPKPKGRATNINSFCSLRGYNSTITTNFTYFRYTDLLEMTVGVVTTCHTQYT